MVDSRTDVKSKLRGSVSFPTSVFVIVLLLVQILDLHADLAREGRRLWVLSIGIDRFADSSYDLSYGAQDAMRVAIASASLGAREFTEVKVSVLGWDASGGSPWPRERGGSVFRNEVLNQMRRIAREASAQDALIFYIASHAHVEDDEIYIWTSEATGSAESQSRNTRHAVSLTAIADVFGSARFEDKLYVFDIHLEDGSAQFARFVRRSGGTGIMAGEAALVSDDFAGGIVPFAFGEALRGAGSQDGVVSIGSVRSYLEGRIPQLAEHLSGRPQFPTTFTFGSNFTLGRIPTGGDQ